jgi:hypothetical protein
LVATASGTKPLRSPNPQSNSFRHLPLLRKGSDPPSCSVTGRRLPGCVRTWRRFHSVKLADCDGAGGMPSRSWPAPHGCCVHY